MKVVIILLVLLLISPAFGELTKEDLRTVVKEELAASEKRTKEYIDLKIDGVEKSLNTRIDGLNQRIDDVEKSLNARIDGVEKSLNARIDSVNIRIDAVDKNLNRVWLVIVALIGLIAATIAIPQIIVAYREKGHQSMQTELEQLRERINALENTPS